MKQNRILFVAGILFLAVLTVSTVYTLHVYQKQLPVVRLAISESGTLPDRTEQFVCIVPKETIYQDSVGPPYVLLVQQREGAWGTEYFCVKKMVAILAQTDTHIALGGMDNLSYPLAVGSDRPVQDGSIVRLGI